METVIIGILFIGIFMLKVLMTHLLVLDGKLGDILVIGGSMVGSAGLTWMLLKEDYELGIFYATSAVLGYVIGIVLGLILRKHLTIGDIWKL